jgi:polyisoprenoid-binding protein YceI
MSRTSIRGIFTLALLVPAAAFAYANSLSLAPQSKISIDGTSSVRSFTCEAPVIDASIETNAPDAAKLVLAGTKAVSSAELTIPSKSLDCGNGTMNGHMLKAIKANEAPEIRFSLASYDLAQAEAGTKVTLNGKLNLGGVEKPITLDAVATAHESGALLLKGEEELKLSDYGLKRPSLMMGTMKVGDVVKVRYELVLKN